MQLNKNKNYLYIKNAESNIIKEAFVILKENISIDKTLKQKRLDKIDVIKEAEMVANSIVVEDIVRKYKSLKWKIIIYRVIVFILGVYIIVK